MSAVLPALTEADCALWWMNRAGKDTEEVRQENRSTYSATVHPEGAAAALLYH